MDERRRVFAASAVVVVLFLLVQFGALALVEPFKDQGFQPVEDPSDPTNSFLYLGLILVATGAMLVVFRYGGQRVIRATLILVSGMLSWYVFVTVLPPVPVGGVAALPLAASAAVVVALTVYPEWYVVDAAGVVMGAGAAGLFGIGFGTLPALVLLVVLAVYDAVSVYGTEHMLTLAEGVMSMKVPVLLVVPTSRSFSFLDVGEDGGAAEHGAGPDGADGNGEHGAGSDGPTPGPSTEGEAGAEPENRAAGPADGAGEKTDDEPDAGEGPLARDALFIGLGDAVIPTVLVASAGFFLDAPTLVPGIALNVPALGAIVGTIAGLIGLLWMVFRGRAHAGLPLLNGGAIAGYLLASLASDVPLDVALGL